MAWGQKAGGVEDLVKRLIDPKLKSLCVMRQRKLDTTDIIKLCSALSSNTALTELSLSQHVISEAAAQALAAMLLSNTALNTINIGDSNFGDVGMAALAKGIAGCACLTTLDAELKGLGPQGAAALSQALPSSHLVKLMLGRNPLGNAGVTLLCSHGWGPSLRTLDLHECQLGPQGVAALSSCSALSTLTHLSLASNPGIGEGATQESLMHLAMNATGLQTLQLQHSNVGDAGVEALATAMGHGALPLLQSLQLSHCALSDDSGLQLASSLSRRACWVTELALGGNPGITDVTALALARVTQARTMSAEPTQDGPTSPTQLQNLDLSSTRVSPSCLAPLCDALSGIQQLCLLGCKLGEGGPLLLQALGAPSARLLRELQVSACRLDVTTVTQLLGALGQGAAPALTSLEMGSNPACQDDGLQEQVEALREARPELSVHWRSGDEMGQAQAD